MTGHTPHHPLERCLHWIERHPSTMLWILIVTTANFALALLEALHIT